MITELELERLKLQIERAERDRDMFRTQVSAEQNMVRELEKQLALVKQRAAEMVKFAFREGYVVAVIEERKYGLGSNVWEESWLRSEVKRQQEEL